MRDTKAFASLSSGLLARKGQARPAMRPQGIGTGAEELGWNDMGDAPVRVTGPRLPADLAGPVPEVVRQQEEIVQAFSEAAAPKAVTRRTGDRKAAFTLRLDTERHRRLRIACAVQNRSAQMLITDALDQWLESLPDVARLAASLPANT